MPSSSAPLPNGSVDWRRYCHRILADDLDADWKQNHSAIMPNLAERLRRGGLSFDNHVAALPVCGPSRSSLLYGRYPHNTGEYPAVSSLHHCRAVVLTGAAAATGYKENCDKASIASWDAKQNDTIGRWLAKSGYHTAFLGKYVNCME